MFKLETENHLSGGSYFTISSNFTDVPGQQYIALSYSANSTTDDSFVKKIVGAQVYVTDDHNNTMFFNESQEGKYQSYNAGIPGRKYTLHISLPDGKKYHSNAEMLNLTPDIQNLYFKFETDNSKNDYTRYGYNVYVDFQDSPVENEFYQWDWTHYTSTSICEVCEKGKRFNNTSKICEKIVLESNDNINQDGVNYFQCNSDCWDISRSDGFDLLSDHYYNGQLIKEVKVHRAPFRALPSQYYLKVHQKKINRSTYLYLKSIKSQIKSNGTLFDVPAQTEFNFNVYSDTDPNEKVLGIFNVYSTKTKIISIPINQVVNGMGPAPGTPDKTPFEEILSNKSIFRVTVDCVNGPNRTSVRPEGWQ